VIDIVEVKTPETEATLVAESIAQKIEKRASYKIVMKRAIAAAMRRGAKGIKINGLWLGWQVLKSQEPSGI